MCCICFAAMSCLHMPVLCLAVLLAVCWVCLLPGLRFVMPGCEWCLAGVVCVAADGRSCEGHQPAIIGCTWTQGELRVRPQLVACIWGLLLQCVFLGLQCCAPVLSPHHLSVCGLLLPHSQVSRVLLWAAVVHTPCVCVLRMQQYMRVCRVCCSSCEAVAALHTMQPCHAMQPHVRLSCLSPACIAVGRVCGVL